ncbi:hypothetical protein [Streptomyces sp. NPDC087460]|uniref:hypothetical protein n=1 Tax=Streptomyces sp. NPDC087460 TaxID=3365791 RepID=UPI003820BB06
MHGFSGAELDGDDGAGGGLADQVVEEDIAGLGRGVGFSAAPDAVGAGVEGAGVAVPEVEGAEAGDDAQVAVAGDEVGGEAVAAGPVGAPHIFDVEMERKVAAERKMADSCTTAPSSARVISGCFEDRAGKQ